MIMNGTSSATWRPFRSFIFSLVNIVSGDILAGQFSRSPRVEAGEEGDCDLITRFYVHCWSHNGCVQVVVVVFRRVSCMNQLPVSLVVKGNST